VDNRPIGVFDSGLGGLSIVSELRKLLPHEDIVYFGDTGRVPYGTRSRETIIKYAKQDIAFLRSKNVKAIIAACGTVSTNLPEDYPSGLDIPFCDILRPAVEAACRSSVSGKIGVIATTASVKSGAYGRTIRAVRPDAVVVENACPLFVPLVENGYIERDNKVTKLVAQGYLSPFRKETVDVLILGCTHFPIISGIIADMLQDQILLIDPGTEVAKKARSLLQEHNLFSCRESEGHTDFYVSDNPSSFSQIASIFLGTEVTEDVVLVDVDSL